MRMRLCEAALVPQAVAAILNIQEETGRPLTASLAKAYLNLLEADARW